MSVRRNRKAWFIGSAAATALALGGGTAWALTALNVDVPLFPSMGENSAQACDTDGVTTSFVYGNSSSNGVRINTATVKGIDAKCASAMMEFLSPSGSVVQAYTATATSGQATMSTSIWTGQFDSIRVTLNP